MKRIWIAIIIFAASISICVGEQIYIKDFCNGLEQKVEAAQKEPTTENLEEIHKYWNKKNDILYAMCQHDMLDELSVSIHQMQSTKDDTIIKSALIDIKAQNYTFYENQKITLSNIS